MKYRREIDGLRAVAVLPVIFYHAELEAFSGGFVGVDVFFVISGYLITTIILTEKEKGTFSLVKFYERRARRILPALFFVMLCCLPFAWLWLLPNHLKEFSQSLTAVSLFSSNILFWRETGYFATAAELKPLLHTWSLAVEEQYYVLFPLFLMLTWRLRKRLIFCALMGLSIVSLAIAHWGAYNDAKAAFFLLPTRGWELAIGALIGFYFLYRKEQAELIASHKVTSEGLGFIGLALICYSVFAFDKSTPFPSFYALIPTVGTALIIVFSTSKSLVGRLLGTKLMVGIGLLSYSTYLWHQPLLVFERHRSQNDLSISLLLTLSALSIVLAYVSWRFVEMPFRNKNAISSKNIFLFAFLGSVFFFAIGLAGLCTNGFDSRYTLDDLKLVEQTHNQYSYVWNRMHELNLRDFENGDKAKILIVGDSYAGDLLNALYESKLDANIDMSTWTIPARCGNLYLPYDFTSSFDFVDKKMCIETNWYNNNNVRSLMHKADQVWLVSHWKFWQAPLISESVDNLVGEFGNKFFVFNRKISVEINYHDLLKTPATDRPSLLNKSKDEIVKINDLLKKSIDPKMLIDVYSLFCDSDNLCHIFNSAAELLTFDGVHLTQYGAQYYGKKLKANTQISGLLQ